MTDRWPIVGVVAATVVAVLAALGGLAYNAGAAALFVGAGVAAGRRLWWRRRPSADQERTRDIPAAAAWAALSASVLPAIPKVQFAAGEYRTVVATLAGAGAVATLAQLVPRPKPSRIASRAMAAAAVVLTAQLLAVYVVRPGSAVRLASPLEGEWYVMHGGRSVFTNAHFVVRGQRHALDLVRVVDGRNLDGPAKELASYHAWGQTLRAPAAGEVVIAVGDLPDQQIGSSDKGRLAGNHVVIRIDGRRERYVALAHLRQGSVTVKAGDRVERGQPIGEVGNSGNTSEPHLHIQVQDKPELGEGRTYPMDFGGGPLRRGHRLRG